MVFCCGLAAVDFWFKSSIHIHSLAEVSQDGMWYVCSFHTDMKKGTLTALFVFFYLGNQI